MQFAEYSFVLTIPGLGPYISARVLASIANPWRFDKTVGIADKRNDFNASPSSVRCKVLVL